MKKILVVYYSRTGTTKKLASDIADLLDADVEELIDTKKRSGLLGYILAGRDAALKKQTILKENLYDVAHYDIVCIGTPVRDFTMSSAIRTYLTKYERALPDTLVFFCTQASSGAETTIQEMAKIVGKRPIASIICSTKEIKKNTYHNKIQQTLVQAGILIQ